MNINPLNVPSNIWSRVKSSTVKIHDKVTHREEDGNTIETTVIHKALVKYYDENDLPYPAWLGQPVKGTDKQQRNSTEQELLTNKTTERFARLNFRDTNLSNNRSINQESNNEPRTVRTGMGSNSTFKDLYANGSDQQQKIGGADKMKERLRRNNYRNNFTTNSHQ